MSKLGRPKLNARPENYLSVVERIRRGELNQGQAADILGVTRQTLHGYLATDYPEEFRGKYRAIVSKRVGKSNQRYTSWLEANIEDRELCDFIREKGKCGVCPRHCAKNRMTKGLGKLISETRIPLKGAEKDLEDLIFGNSRFLTNQ